MSLKTSTCIIKVDVLVDGLMIQRFCYFYIIKNTTHNRPLKKPRLDRTNSDLLDSGVDLTGRTTSKRDVYQKEEDYPIGPEQLRYTLSKDRRPFSLDCSFFSLDCPFVLLFVCDKCTEDCKVTGLV